MAGVTGARVKVGFARCNTWGVPASVLSGVLIESTDGLDGQPQLVDDPSFGQAFMGVGEIGDHSPVTPDLSMMLRYDGAAPRWMAGGMGSAAAPVVVSSVAADSLIAYSHVITPANEITQYYTLAADMVQYVLEVPSLKIRGYTVKVGDGGRLNVSFPIVGTKGVYDSTVNINSTLAGIVAEPLGTKVFRKHGVIRMNKASIGALGASASNSLIMDLSFGAPVRPMAQDHVFGSDYITEADDDGWPEINVEVTYARMNTVSANSLAIGLKNGETWKADYTFTSNLFINSVTPYSLLVEFPALQLKTFNANINGRGQARPKAVFSAKLAAAAPTGMTTTGPVRVTVVNMNSANLLA